MRSTSPAIPLLLAVLSLAGCHGGPKAVSNDVSAHVASLNHVVLISLADPADAAECEADCRRMLAEIPVVRTLWVGTPVDTGRAAVDGDYEVGLCVGLDGTDDLQRYLEAPSHLTLVEKWRPRAAGFRIFDVGSEVSGR